MFASFPGQFVSSQRACSVQGHVFARRRRCQRLSARAGGEKLQEPLSAMVSAALVSEGGRWMPFIPQGSLLLSSNAVFEGDFVSLKGAESIRSTAAAWEAVHNEEMPGLTRSVLRVSQTAPGRVQCQLRYRWLSAGLQNVEQLARKLPGMRIKYYDLLDRIDKVSFFSWKSLAVLLTRALFSRELALPEAVINSTVIFEFAPSDSEPSSAEASAATPLVLSRIVERLELVPSFKRGGVRNRRVTKDLLAFLEGRRPRGTPAVDWDALLWNELGLRAIPGMGQFDIEGLDDDARRNAVEGVGQLLAFATIIVITFGTLVGGVYFKQLSSENVIRAALIDDEY